MIKRFALELNRYARRKGVTLQYSSQNWGQDWVDYDDYQPWVMNREDYPDGAAGPAAQAVTRDSPLDLLCARGLKWPALRLSSA